MSFLRPKNSSKIDWRTKTLVFLALFLTFTLPPAFAHESSEDAFLLVQEAVENQDQLTLEGIEVLAYWWSGNLTVRNVHVLKQQRRLRFEYLPTKDHPYQEAISDGEFVVHLNPSKHLAFRSPYGDPYEEEETILNLAAKNYEWVNEGIEKVASIPATRISARPRSGDHVFARYWISEPQKAILREERYDEKGDPVFASSYTTVIFLKDLPIDLFKPNPRDRVRNLPSPKELQGSQALASLDFKPLFPKRLPAGFGLIGTYLTAWPGHRKLHLRYSDGLRNVSIYENLRSGVYHRMKGSDSVFLGGRSAELLETPEGKLLRFPDGNLTIAVIGNIPAPLAEQVALSLVTPMHQSAFHRLTHHFRKGLRTLARLVGVKE